MGVYDRNKGYPDRKPNLWIRYTIDEATRAKHGLSDREQREPANDSADKRAAAAQLAGRRRELRDGTWRPVSDSSSKLLTQHYAERWCEARKKAGIASAENEKRRLEHHILPAIGHLPLEGVQRDHLKELVSKLKETTGKRTQRPLSPREIHHIYAAARGMFRSALEEGLILRTPCTLRIKKEELPKKRDADPRWRSQAIYTREEIEMLISDERVPLQRRVLYGLTFFAYVRFGESAGRQWRDYDPVATPLGKLLVPTQYEDEDTKMEVPREVPVHPKLAALLASWRLEGFPFFFGRPPRPDDYIVPKLRGQGPQNVKRAWQNLQKDLATLGLRPRRTHDLRRTAISLSLADGADKYLLQWVTHGPRGETAFDLYNTPPWEALCKQVARLKIGLRGASVATIADQDRRTLRRTLAYPDSATARDR